MAQPLLATVGGKEIQRLRARPKHIFKRTLLITVKQTYWYARNLELLPKTILKTPLESLHKSTHHAHTNIV